MSTKKRLCVIGAGPSGLCFLKYCSGKLDKFDVVCYEQGSEIGGLWVYTDETGVDKYGEPIFSSIYKDLRVNLPKPLMTLPGLEFSEDLPSFVQHQEVLKYLQNYTEKYQLDRFIKLNHKVVSVDARQISDDYWGTKWTVEVETLRQTPTITTSQEFDAVIVCCGRFSMPKQPDYEGLKDFKGSVIHSHDYRVPDVYKGLDVLVIGGGISTWDITPEIAPYTNRIYVSHYADHIFTGFPDNVELVTGIEKFNENGAILSDGREINVDAVMFCTGYQFNYPFLTESCGVNVDKYTISPLYKHMISIHKPTLFLLGIPDLIVYIISAVFQSQYAFAILDGMTELPCKKEMLEYESNQVQIRKEKGWPDKYIHRMWDLQFDYLNSLTDFPGARKIPAWYKPLCDYLLIKYIEVPQNILKTFEFKITETNSFQVTYNPTENSKL